MKWIGQHIWDFYSRFRNDVYLESLTTTTDTSVLVVDSNNKVCKNTTTLGGDITEVGAGVGLSGGGAGPGAVTLTVDFSEFSDVTPADGDKLATLDSDGANEQLTTVASLATLFAGTGLTAASSVINVDAAQSGITSLGTLTGLTLDGDKTVTPGDGAMIHVDTSTITDSNTSASGTAAKYTHVNIEGPALEAGNDNVTITDAATVYISSAPSTEDNPTLTNAYSLWVDAGASKFDGGIIGDVTGDVSGTAATVTGATQAAITTLAGLTSFGAAGATTNILSGDIDWYNPVNDGNPQLNWGASATERFQMRPFYYSGSQTLQAVFFRTDTASSTANFGLFRFQVDGTSILDIDDGGIDLDADKGISINGTDILTDSSGTATLSNIDALDATTIATMETAMEANIDTLSNLTTATSLVQVATITSGTWEGTAIATDQQKHLAHYKFMGFNNSDTATNVYEYSATMTDTKAPMEHDKNHNATITTAMDVSTFFSSGGQVVPQAGTVKRIVGWAHTGGTSAVHKIALVKLTPAENDNTDVSPVLIDEVSWTSLGADKLKAINETTITAASVAAGDILMTMIKDDTGGRTVYFNLTVEIEF